MSMINKLHIKYSKKTLKKARKDHSVIKGTVMQTKNTLINDHLRVSKVS